MIRLIKYAFILLVLIIALLPFYYNTEKYDITPEIREKQTGEFIKLSQGYTHYQQANKGAGKTVVLVHGFSVPYYIWEPTYQLLAKQGYHVIRYDLYGRGYSDRPNLDYTLQLFDDQLVQLLDGLAIEKAIDIIGLSMGGAVVAKFVADHPQRVNKVVFVDPSHEAYQSSTLDTPLLGEFLVSVVKMPNAAQSQIEDFYQPEKFPNWPQKYKPQMQYKGFKRAILSTLRHFMKVDKLYLYQAIGKLHKPVLLFWGKQDNTLPLSRSARVAQALNIKTTVIDKSGHLPHYERPEIVNPILLEFLAQ